MTTNQKPYIDDHDLLSAETGRITVAWARTRQRLTNALYGLIQPRNIPAQPRRLPPIRVEVLITLLGLVGWGIFLLYYDRVSPIAAVDLRYDRTQIAQIAADYVRSRGLDVAGYQRVTTFGSDRMAQIYLERTAGVSRMNQLVRDKEAPVWTWTVRWFVPEQREEVYVHLLPTGEVIGFDHVLPEDAAGPTVTAAEAQQIAERYLVEDRGLSLAGWELYDVSARTLPQRTDHTLTWVRQGLEIGEGDVRMSITVRGEQVGRLATWVHIPEAFSRGYTEQRSRAGLLGEVSIALGWLFVAGGVAVVLWGLRAGLKIGWAPVLAGGAAGLVDVADSLNSLSMLGAGYDTAVSYQTYLLNVLGYYLISAAQNALTVAFLVIAGQWLLRAVWPRQDKLIPAPQDRWAAFARSAWRGTMVGGLMAAYMILFYTIAKGLGAWSPVRTPEVDLLATPVPFVAAIWLGLLPALREELQYRALGIGLTMRLTRGRVLLALLAPALLWAFAHSGYLTDPIWLRGVELTISAVLLEGLFFLLFDLTTAVMAHYTYNASLIAIVLIRSGKPAFVLTGLLAFLLGLAPALVVLLRRLAGRGKEKPAALKISVGVDEDWAEILAEHDLPQEARSPSRHLVCLRSESGQLVGYAAGAILSDACGNRSGQVVAVAVAKPYRGRYYATALYRSLAEWFHEQGVSQVQAQVPAANAGTATFWIVQGFRPDARVWSKRMAGD
jgi:GNAT superfamily N-acetyltransferase